jgi:hypothetical protein
MLNRIFSKIDMVKSTLLTLLILLTPALMGGSEFKPGPVYPDIAIDMTYVPADKVPGRYLKPKGW